MGSFVLPNAFPILTREDGGLLWTRTTTATPEELRLHFGYLLWKLWREIQGVREFARFMALARDETPDLPAWLANPGTLPPWVTSVPEDAYQALDREWNGDADEENEA
jgi:hypothetical protein